MDHLTHSPTGRVRIGCEGRHLLRPDGRPVAPTNFCQEVVLINVYDLHWTNRMTKRLRLAAYHTGLELHGVEIAYGDCGVFNMKPRDVVSMEAQMTYKKSVRLGSTNYSREDVLLICQWLGRSEFTGPMYDLLRRNCNHFSAAMGRLLCPHAQFPAWINSLAGVGVRLPFVKRSIRRYAEVEEGGDNADDPAGLKEKKHRGLREICANLSRSSMVVSTGQQGKNSECNK